jgi:hypothetical protein
MECALEWLLQAGQHWIDDILCGSFGWRVCNCREQHSRRRGERICGEQRVGRSSYEYYFVVIIAFIILTWCDRIAHLTALAQVPARAED